MKPEPATKRRLLARRLVQLYIGLFLCGTGIALMVRAKIGVAPWDVLSTGIATQTGLSFGLVVILTGLSVLLLWIPLKQRPGLGTISNMVLLGVFADAWLAVIPFESNLLYRSALFAAGLLLFGLGSGAYIGSRFGPGPRDGLMTGLVRVTGWPIWLIRTSLEVTVLGVGWLLGGNVGVGTVVFALAIGPICNLTIPWLTVPVAVNDELERELEGDVSPSHVPGDSPAT